MKLQIEADGLRSGSSGESKGVWTMTIKGKTIAIWSVVASILFLTSALPTAYGLDFPVTSRVDLEVEATPLAATVNPADNAAALYGSVDLAATTVGAMFSSDLALVSAISAQVEMARTAIGARKVAQMILTEEYGFDQKQYSCLNSLWTKESHWNYKAHNYRSGAHGIAQALPAEKMSVVATDWRTNPVTQIRWGIRYITMRYDTPCKAWSKWKTHHYY
jgi:hypothetical protein